MSCLSYSRCKLSLLHSHTEYCNTARRVRTQSMVGCWAAIQPASPSCSCIWYKVPFRFNVSLLCLRPMHAPQSPVHLTANLALPARGEFARAVRAERRVPAGIAFVRDGAALAFEAQVATTEPHAAAASSGAVSLFALVLRLLRVAAATAAHGVCLMV